MLSVAHPSNNSVLTAPAGDGRVMDLPVTVLIYDGKYLATRSFWMPTEEELASLLAGEPLCFEIFARTHAPVMLGVIGVSMSPTVPLEG